MSNQLNQDQLGPLPQDSWVIGDVHGCLRTLKAMLSKIERVQADPHCVFIGDLVGKGPDSAGVIETLMNNSDNVSVVLGNHDLHLIACHMGVAKARPGDHSENLLKASESNKWIDWLKTQNFLFDLNCANRRYQLVHAGIHPLWSEEELDQRINQLTMHVRSDDWSWYKDPGSEIWHTANVITRMRCLQRESLGLANDFTGHPDDAGPDLIPWFEATSGRPQDPVFIFGHWAALGRYSTEKVECLDSGCVYGHELTAFQPMNQIALVEKNIELD